MLKITFKNQSSSKNMIGLENFFLKTSKFKYVTLDV